MLILFVVLFAVFVYAVVTVTNVEPADNTYVNGEVALNVTVARDQENGTINVSWILINASDTFAVANQTNTTVNQSEYNSTFDSTLFTDGNYSMNITVINSTFANASTQITNITIDNTLPVVNAATPANNTITNNNAVIFNVTATDANLANCTLFGNLSGNAFQVNQTINLSSGVSTNFTEKVITDGVYLWNVRCEDLVGNVGAFIVNRTLTIDTIVPFLNFTAPTPGNGTTLTTDSFTINVTANDTNALTILLELDGVNETFDTQSGNSSFETKASLANGAHTIRVHATDTAGNVNTTELRTITIDVATSSGGGGGGGGGGTKRDTIESGVPLIPDPIEVELDEKGTTFTLLDEQVVFLIDGVNWTLKLKESDGMSVTLILNAEGISYQFTLNVSKTRSFDLDDDGIDDISIKILDSDSNSATIMAKLLGSTSTSEGTTPTSTAPDETLDDAESVKEAAEDYEDLVQSSKSSVFTLLIMLGIVGVLILVGVHVFYFRK